MQESTTATTLGLPNPSDDPLTDVLRRGARALLAQAIEAEVAAYLDARAHLKDESGRQQVVRNGHLPERTIQTGIGPVEVRQPRVRDRRPAADREQSTSAILPPYPRKTKSLEDLIPWLYLVFKLKEAASKRWRLLNGSSRLQAVVRGVKFVDAIEVKDAA